MVAMYVLFRTLLGSQRELTHRGQQAERKQLKLEHALGYEQKPRILENHHLATKAMNCLTSNEAALGELYVAQRPRENVAGSQ